MGLLDQLAGSVISGALGNLQQQQGGSLLSEGLALLAGRGAGAAAAS